MSKQKVIYIGAFVSDEIGDALFGKYGGPGKRHAHHVTLAYNPSMDLEGEFCVHHLGADIEIRLDKLYAGKVCGQEIRAISVTLPDGIPCLNPIPHLTISSEGSPAMSNMLLADNMEGLRTVTEVGETITGKVGLFMSGGSVVLSRRRLDLIWR